MAENCGILSLQHFQHGFQPGQFGKPDSDKISQNDTKSTFYKFSETGTDNRFHFSLREGTLELGFESWCVKLSRVVQKRSRKTGVAVTKFSDRKRLQFEKISTLVADSAGTRYFSGPVIVSG